MFSIFTYHLDFGTSVAMEHNKQIFLVLKVIL